AVNAVALSSNGQWLASVGADKTLRLWNPADGKLLTAFGASTAPVNAVAFNPNNSAVYTGGYDGFIRAWQLPPVTARALPAHGEAINALALSGDGRIVVTASNDKTVRMVNFDKGDNAKTLTGPATGVVSTAIAPNGSLVAGGTGDGKLYVWNTGDNKLLTQNKIHTGAVSTMAINGGNSQLATAGPDGTIKLWALPPVPTRVLGHPEAVLASAVRGDGKRVFTG